MIVVEHERRLAAPPRTSDSLLGLAIGYSNWVSYAVLLDFSSLCAVGLFSAGPHRSSRGWLESSVYVGCLSLRIHPASVISSVLFKDAFQRETLGVLNIFPVLVNELLNLLSLITISFLFSQDGGTDS